MPEKESEFEIKHYVEIIQYFDSEDDPINREMFRDVQLIELMNELKQDPEVQEVIKNSIVIINALVDKDAPSDLYNSTGNPREALSEEELEILKSNLKQEQ
ncbi:MAG: hypothetical protein ACFFAS_12245 [Promethearchaeota archaeon]